MKESFIELINYLKNPVLEQDKNTDFNYRIQKFFYLLLISLATSFLITPVFILIEELNWVNLEEHALEDMMERYSKPMIFFMIVIIAPIFEEIFFRAPLTLFKKAKSFKNAFYVFAIIFGFIHLTNYKISTNVLLFAPLLVLPQTILGGYFGFIRIRFGLQWSIALHACYNGVLMLMTLFFDI